jgi:peptidoglycan/LPS O-acetylase OafA/YrhL
MRRSIARKLLVILFALLALNGFEEALKRLIDPADTPVALAWLQLITGSLATAAGIGLWRRTRWAPIVIVLWGLEAATMVVLLGPILQLEADARAGLWPGAVAILVIAGLCTWYAKRTLVA